VYYEWDEVDQGGGTPTEEEPMAPRPMEPWIVVQDGHTYGNAAAAAALCVDPDTGEAILPSTYAWYVRVGKPAGNRAPGPHHKDKKTRHQMFDLDEVAAWHAKRRGRGNWSGIGARARRPVIGTGTCPTCRQTTGVDDRGWWVNHKVASGTKRLCKASKEKADSYTLRPDQTASKGE
jgi:hypothetical protein